MSFIRISYYRKVFLTLVSCTIPRAYPLPPRAYVTHLDCVAVVPTVVPTTNPLTDYRPVPYGDVRLYKFTSAITLITGGRQGAGARHASCRQSNPGRKPPPPPRRVATHILRFSTLKVPGYREQSGGATGRGRMGTTARGDARRACARAWGAARAYCRFCCLYIYIYYTSYEYNYTCTII